MKKYKINFKKRKFINFNTNYVKNIIDKYLISSNSKKKKVEKSYFKNKRRTRIQRRYLAKAQQIVGELLLKKNNKIKFNFRKYLFFFKILLKTRLKLLRNKTSFKIFFSNYLKKSLKNILFKNKSIYYNIVKLPFNGLNFYNEYKLWFFNFKKLKKIPFKLIRLYSKFYFNKLIYNLKVKSLFFFIYERYLGFRLRFKKIKYRRLFKHKKMLKKINAFLYTMSKSYIKYFISSRNVIFSFMRNSRVYMYYKKYEIIKNDININNNIKIFLFDLSKRRSFYVSKYTYYSNFFFIYWATVTYGYRFYGNYKKKFEEFHLFNHYFKFFKKKNFFFNYLINFCFLYVQKINLNLLNYIFILNQYKTKLVISLPQFYKYLIFFFFKRKHYLENRSIKLDFKQILPCYFSFFSVFFKQLSIELTNWYSLLNNSQYNAYQSTFLFRSCFILHNTNAVYFHHRYKYLYYYRVYNYYIFYIFYYLYNHLFKVYKRLKLKTFKLSYDLVKYNEYNRYYLGLRTRILILTIRNRYKRGFSIEKIFKNLKFFLRESLKKKELAGYYISICGRYKRSSRSNKLIIKKGVYSFNKIDLKIDSSYGTLNTKFGIAGIKVIFAFR